MEDATSKHDLMMPHEFDPETGGIVSCPPNCPVELARTDYLLGHGDDGSEVRHVERPPLGQIVKWADRAMFRAEADPEAAAGEPVVPRVVLISMTPNPLEVMAAAAELYRGRIVREVSQLTAEQCLFWWDEMTKTKLHAPLEYIDLHFFIEGVTRAFTHQLVRQRTAVYVQESLRFAVKENAAMEVQLPPSLVGLKDDDPRRIIWENTIRIIGENYMQLINAGVPAEDARGLLPTNITTRVHYKTNLRNLAEHAGLRLCSQAQQEWKLVWNEMIRAIRNYGPESERWQQREICKLFKPICYQTGKCEFNGENDRWCVIRERVQAHHRQGDHPSTWDDISPLEPLLHGAAIQEPE